MKYKNNRIHHLPKFYCIMFCILLFSCTSIKDNYDIKYIQEDYTRNDLLQIMSFGSQEIINCEWKISTEELKKQKPQTLIELMNHLDLNKIINYSEYFINNAYDNLYKNNMYFYSFEIITINDKKYGENRYIDRDDWIIIITYEKYRDNFTEKIFMLPDYKIIISSNNYENVNEK